MISFLISHFTDLRPAKCNIHTWSCWITYSWRNGGWSECIHICCYIHEQSYVEESSIPSNRADIYIMVYSYFIARESRCIRHLMTFVINLHVHSNTNPKHMLVFVPIQANSSFDANKSEKKIATSRGSWKPHQFRFWNRLSCIQYRLVVLYFPNSAARVFIILFTSPNGYPKLFLKRYLTIG